MTSTARRKTTINVNGERWDVPRGFGVDYKRVALDEIANPATDTLRDLLELIGYTAAPAEIAKWPLRARVEACVYACNVHARASDYICQAHPRPAWFGEAWTGPERGKGIWRQRSPTHVAPRAPTQRTVKAGTKGGGT